MKNLARIFIGLLLTVVIATMGAAPALAGFDPNLPTFSNSQVLTDTTTLTNLSPSTNICDAPYESYTVTLPDASTVGSNGFIFKRVLSSTYIYNENDVTVSSQHITCKGAFTSDNKKFFTVDSAGGKVIVVNTFTHTIVGSLVLNASGLGTQSVAISSDNNTLYVPSGNADGKVYVVNISTPASPTLSSTQVDGTNTFTYCAISNNGTKLYLTGINGFFKMDTSAFT